MIRKKASRESDQDASSLLSIGKGSTDRQNVPPVGSLQEEAEDDAICICSNEGYNSSSSPSGNFFRDGKTKIDFVLVWEEKVLPSKKRRSKPPLREDNAAAGTRAGSEHGHRQHGRWRRKFLSNLQNVGLLMEKEETRSENKTIHYLKLSTPWEALLYHAEELGLRGPLQAHPNPARNGSADLLRKLRIPNIMDQRVPNQPVDHYTCAFRKSKLGRFLGSDLHDSYFTSTQRHCIVYEVLAQTIYGKRKRAERGLDRLLGEGVFSAAFPLHEGPFELPEYEVPNEELNPRQVLYRFWAQWQCWYKYQPLDHIREYFGEKVAIFFAWLGFYTAWLIPAAAVGSMVFLTGLFTVDTDVPAQEICNSRGQFLMCPLCDKCGSWNISEICSMAKVGHLFDHLGTVFFSIFMSFWAVTFLEFWKRKNARLAHHWDCSDIQEQEERPRPEFAAAAPRMTQNPITGGTEPYFSEQDRLSRTLTGSMAIVIMLCVVLIFLLSVIIYRGIVSTAMYHTGNTVLVAQAGNIANISSSMGNLVLILLMTQAYTALAEKLTRWEMHRTQTQHEDAFTFKVFIFQFVNFYASPFYVAFFKGRFVGYPGRYGRLLGMRMEDCGPGGCLIELAQQLFVLMVGKQVVRRAQEFLLPKLNGWCQKRKLAPVRGAQICQESKLWEDDYELTACEGLFEEHLEMALQFGFITIFVAAFPLAPLFALLNNWVEIRLDAQKFVCGYRRPVAERAKDIGVWFFILEALAQIAVIVNAFLIAFTSDFLPRLLYQYENDSHLHGYVNFTLAYSPSSYVDHNHTVCRYKAFHDAQGNYTLFYWKLLAVRLGFIIAFEHTIFFCSRLIDWLVPEVPKSLEVKIQSERYLAKQALADPQDVLPAQAACYPAKT